MKIPATPREPAEIAALPDYMFEGEPYTNPDISPPETPDPREPRDRTIDWGVWGWVGGGVGAVLLLIFLIWLGWPSSEPLLTWEEKNQKQVLAYVDEFESNTSAEDYSAALEKYAELQKFINGQTITQPPLREALDRAAAEKRKVAGEVDRRAATRQAIANILTEEGMRRGTRYGSGDPTTTPATMPTPVTRPVIIHSSFLHVTHGDIPADPVSDERIGAAIQKGANWLLGSFDPRTHYLKNDVAPADDAGTRGGADALCVYALLQCGLTLHDEKLDIHQDTMKGLLRALDTLPIEKHIQVYGRSIRANALALTDRKDDRKYLRADAEWLMKHASNGAYSYGDEDANAVLDWDNSNSQYGLLGVWAAAETGLEVPTTYWQAVMKHWVDCQAADGGWNYKNAETSTLSMTLAGVASLLVCHDYLEPVQISGKDVSRAPYPAAVARGLAWLEVGQHILGDGSNWGYTLYGVERVGLASGYKYFGTHDWYRERSQKVLDNQQPNGSWNDVVDTAYALLFLARGRHLIIMNKVRFDGTWSNRPRDAANLARFASRELERPISFQIVNIERDFNDWQDAPILYIASNAAPDPSDDQLDNIRRYVEAGGLLFTQADGGSPAFDKFAHDLAKKLFPQYPMVSMPEDHPIYSILYKVQTKQLIMVGNDIRTWMVHSPRDLSISWQHRLNSSSESAMQLGVNLYLYAAGKSELRNRTVSTYVPDPPAATGGTIRVARLRYDGAWDPEPAAWPRFGRVFQQGTSCHIEIVPTEIESLNTISAPFAHLTGCMAHAWTPPQEQTIRAYVNGGGVLFIDSLLNPEFSTSSRTLLARAFPDAKLEKLPGSNTLFQSISDGMSSLPASPPLRPYALRLLGKGGGAIEGMTYGKGRIVLCPIDVTSGLLGTSTWGIVGYPSSYSKALMQNLLLWTACGAQ